MNLQSIIGGAGRVGRMLLVATIATCVLAAAPAAAAVLAGSTLSIGTKQVPLPRGEWSLLAERTIEVRPSAAGGSATLASVVVGAGDARTLRNLVVVRASRAPVPGGFGLADACRRADMHSARIVSRGGSMVALCTFVGHVLHGVTADADPAWAAAFETVQRSGKRLPETWLVVGVRIADGSELLDVRYYFNPEAVGSPASEPVSAPSVGSGWADRAGAILSDLFGTASPPNDPRWLASDWSVGSVAGRPRRAAVIRELDAWAERVHRLVYIGFKGGSVGEVEPPPTWIALWSPAAPEAGAGLPGEIALWKTLSWRAVGSSLDAAVGYALTGSVGIAGGLTVVGGLMNAGVYYLHEKTWEIFGWEAGPGDLTTMLPPAGIER